MLKVIPEPLLEFGDSNTHVDIRGGLASFGPFDVNEVSRPTRVSLGVVATREDRALVEKWLVSVANGIPAKESRQPNLFPPFPALGRNGVFQSEFIIEEVGELPALELTKLCAESDLSAFCQRVALRLSQEAMRLTQKRSLHVILIVLPNQILSKSAELAAARGGVTPDGIIPDLHDILKAKALVANIQTQIVWPATIGGKMISRQNLRQMRKQVVKQQQDEATRAWNLVTAIYYKAKGFPWRIPKDTKKLASCFVGLGFFKNADNTALHTSMAQVFDERGDGLILQGGPAEFSKTDRRPYLPAAEAKQLILQMLEAYEAEHHHSPARCVFHRASAFKEEEVEGIQEALQEKNIRFHDLVSIRSSDMRLCRIGAYPIPRGACMTLDEDRALLYTRGSVEYFSTYPGNYVPRALEVRKDSGDSDVDELCAEILSLTKMNWNNTQFDGGKPITLRAAQKVGDVLRWVPQFSPIPHRFSFFM
ncbi:MAG: hypothetical protein RLY93_07730 [Sumerlaeia bacterium]